MWRKSWFFLWKLSYACLAGHVYGEAAVNVLACVSHYIPDSTLSTDKWGLKETSDSWIYA